MYWGEIVFLMSIILIVVILSKKVDTSQFHEGFTQSKEFVLKTDNDIYDNFYAFIYNDLFDSQKRSVLEYEKIIKMTQPTKDSKILEIGSGTGELLNILTNNGLDAYGIDQSKDMVDFSKKRFPKINVMHSDVNQSMVFYRNSFTHICCLDFTFYHMKNKKKFLENCYFWLKPNGYFILHLANKDKFDTTVPAANPLYNDNVQNYSKDRIKDTKIDFVDFEYFNRKRFNNNELIIKETFKDGLSHKVRQNELTLYMEDLEEIVKMCINVGFTPNGKVNYISDKEQFIYIFEKRVH